MTQPTPNPQSSPSSQPSSTPRPRPIDRDQDIIRPRPGNRNFPYVISPRATSLLANRPALQWNRIANAKNYTVTVRATDREDLTWTQQASADQVCRDLACVLEYPAERPPLEQEVDYRLVIEADNDKTSDEESTLGLGFRLLDSVQAAQVNEEAQRIETQNLPASEKALALANLYWNNNLIAEASQVLTSLLESEKTAEVYLWSGDLYLLIGLTLEADVEYQKVSELAESSQNDR